ncbi:hypothetical protein NGRA_2082 [Nosema granulosis]|uniref:Uncharacterized protein n=1 Tax=Nosema granulosis TaxID=83296 RepID=A0A9P6KYH7_9MICR|nr:hypothetical protein NGRA_2082 [Nosema granulosis]
MTLVMIVHLVLTLVNLVLFLIYVYSNKSSIDFDVTEVLNIVTNKEYEFSEWALVFVFLFVIVPSTVICMILISFKIYTHDFIKPIQKSYLTVVHSYLTCLLFCKVLSDFALKATHDFSHEDLKYDMSSHVVLINLMTIFMFFIIFIPTFFLLEAKLASYLNSVPVKNLGLLKKNIGCIVFCSSVFTCYLLYFFKICDGVSTKLDSRLACFYIACLAFYTAFLANVIFYVLYLRTMYYFSNIYTRIYRDYIAL